LVLVMMGSDSDWELVEPAVKVLKDLGVPVRATVASAHRTPDRVRELVQDPNIQVIIAAAGGAAHLAGVAAAHTVVPVIGLPLARTPLGGLDALLATAQMPAGIPVASVAVDGGANAGWLAAEILAVGDGELRDRLQAARRAQAEGVAAKAARLEARLHD
jgi:5-(carboxyamino)imidazole ribonucleotide mutase